MDVVPDLVIDVTACFSVKNTLRKTEEKRKKKEREKEEFFPVLKPVSEMSSIVPRMLELVLASTPDHAPI